jgi:hypothetical protein
MLLTPFIEQDNIFRVMKTPITGVPQTDTFNNLTATDPAIVQARTSGVSIFVCPSRRGPGELTPIDPGNLTVTGHPGDYAASGGDAKTSTTLLATTGVFTFANASNLAAFQALALRIQDIVDGTSNTVMIGEKHIPTANLFDPNVDAVVYSAGIQNSFYRVGGPSNPLAQSPTTSLNSQFGSWHSSVVQFVLGDGSVRGIPVSIPGTVLGYLTNVSDGNPVPSLD